MAKKKAQRPVGRTYEVPRFKFKRHRTPQSVLQAYVSGGGREKVALKDVVFADEDGKDRESGPELASIVEANGLWGFVETKAKPHIVHFWHDGKRTESELVHFFGHEMGHCVGKPLKDGWPEENRADDYGFVARQAVEAARKTLGR